MPKILSCDICGSFDRCREDYDGNVFCYKHTLERQILELTRDYEELDKWINSTYITKLHTIKETIEKAKVELKNYESDNTSLPQV